MVPFIAQNIQWDGKGIWYEPFMGSGVVAFNLLPSHAVLSDINPHLINFYTAIQKRKITPRKMRRFLRKEGKKLEQTEKGLKSYYYEVRDRFNESHDPFDFLFLNRSCFNGLMRFNS